MQKKRGEKRERAMLRVEKKKKKKNKKKKRRRRRRRRRKKANNCAPLRRAAAIGKVSMTATCTGTLRGLREGMWKTGEERLR